VSSAPVSVASVVRAEGWSKTFSGRTVLKAVDLDLRPGEVHGLVGQNGSGKSTLIKILAGYHAPDAGARLSILGEPVELPLHPGEAASLGLSFVHQDLGLFDTGTVLENLRLGLYETRPGWRIPWARERQRARAALARFGLDVDPDTKVEQLRDVDRAVVAIVRALDRLEGLNGGGALILDEPTSFLPRDGIERLFAAVRDVAAAGFAVLFVTHRLDEIAALTDRVSVLRDGALVATLETAATSESELVETILGFTLDELYPMPHAAADAVALSVRDLAGHQVEDLSFDVHRGEILGLTGLQGMGYEEVPYLLFGATPAAGGTVTRGDGPTTASSLSPQSALQLGLALLPANRQRLGVIGPASVSENVTIPTLGRFFHGGLLDRNRESAAVAQMLIDFDVQPPEATRSIATLSGGNQQKALLGKWFATDPAVLMLHEPTQGVDVGARRQIFEQIRNAADRGTAFLMASTEYDDLAHLCDRVLVFRDGRVVAELHGAQLTQERLVEQCFRGASIGGADQ
jgi:ribose transport system ATP-binding protein